MSNSDAAQGTQLSQWPRGSEWRRWDLHIHTPYSQLGDAFPGVSWEDYVEVLESSAQEHNISVIGVTDYMSIDGYARLHEAKATSDKLATVDLLIPNIEFRISPQTDNGKAINLHILVDPQHPDHVEKIHRALRNLKFVYKGQGYGCCREELIEFAQAQDPTIDDEEAAYKFGISQFKPDRSEIIDWLKKEAWLRANSLIGIANGKDGISGLPVDGWGAIRDEILGLCDFVFSGNPQDRLHYLGLKPNFPPEEIVRQYRSLKPCVHGSDAHKPAELFCPKEERYCWIKCDPNFNGLRQILWEPADRVHIGNTRPQVADETQCIASMTIGSSSGWFKTNEIEFNPGLVAIIGEKGSGKTAIADLLGFASGVTIDKTSQSSFIAKGDHFLDGTDIALQWGKGEVTQAKLIASPYEESARPRVRYLSQDFVEQLCSADHQGRELQSAIEEVVFGKLDEVQREGYSSFSELRRARESASSSKRESLRGELATVHKEVDRLREEIEQRGFKVKSKEEAEKQAKDLIAQLPDATASVDKDKLGALEKNRGAQKELEEKISELMREKRQFEAARDAYSETKERTRIEVEKVSNQLSKFERADQIINKLYPTWDDSADNLIAKAITDVETEISSMRGSADPSSGDTGTLESLRRQVKKLEESLAQDEVARERVLSLQKQVSDRQKAAERLQKEIDQIDNVTNRKYEDRKSHQITLYLQLFESLKSDEDGLKDLYKPLEEAIAELESEMQFSVAVGYQIDLDSWLSKFNSFLDNRRTGTESIRAEVEKSVKQDLLPAWKEGKKGDIERAIGSVYALVEPESFPKKYGTPSITPIDLMDWLFSVEHIEITYKVCYAGTELEFLSPGTRGIALLVLYLLMDQDDTRPLVIDQPEGNLDNSSVYLQLVPYIRKAKSRRQIILITHNPNLVVGTDAEQVIVATADRPSTQPYPTIEYASGALEHSSEDPRGVRETVCLFLEGGDEAFRVRENRYSLKIKPNPIGSP